MKPRSIRTDAGAWARANPELREQFIRRAHELVAAGAARLDLAALAGEEETTITGELCAAIDAFLREMSRPDWCEHFSVHEEVPVNDGVKKGKARDRVDIEIRTTTISPPVFSFEAKCMRDSHSVSAYSGEDGVGCFVRARYAREFDFAGMLGYVCARTTQAWVSALETKLDELRKELGLAAGAVWAMVQGLGALGGTRRSLHARDGLDAIEVYHSFVVCRAPTSPV